MSRPLYLVLLALVLGGALPTVARAEDERPRADPAVAAALEELHSAAERDRRAAVQRLVALLPGSRGPVIAALSTEAPTARPHLAEVLVADASPAAIRALLGLLQATDARLCVHVRRLLVRSEVATQRVLEAWAGDPALKAGPDGTVTSDTLAFERMLRMAETERIFLSRKSRTGSTGSYRGQYEVLEPYRDTALDMCVGLITDRALPEPGVATAGAFQFLRPSPVHIDLEELKGMAAHAFSELAKPTDRLHLFTLVQHLTSLKQRLDWLGARHDDFRLVLGRYSDLLMALYLVEGERYQGAVDAFLELVRVNASREWQYVVTSSYLPSLLLRARRYAEAIEEYERTLDWRTTRSRAATHYNLACAYAQWGEASESDRARDLMYRKAIENLEQAADHRWSDIGWMREDRDLLPIRDTDRYRALVRRIEESLALPEDD